MASGDDLARLGRGWVGLGSFAPGVPDDPQAPDPDAETIELFLGEEQASEAAGIRQVAPSEEDVRSRQDVAERLVRQFLRLCEHPRTSKHALNLIQSSVEGDPTGQRLLRLIDRLNRGQLALRAPERVLATQVVTATLAGVAVNRYIRPVEPLGSAELDEVVAVVTPVVRAALSTEVRGAAAADQNGKESS